jgi:hypothetical protein
VLGVYGGGGLSLEEYNKGLVGFSSLVEKGFPGYLLKFWYARLTIDNVTSLSPNHRHSHMPPPSTLTFT